MPISLIKTKLRRPALPVGQADRPRLCSRLDEGLRPEERLLLVSAPAGYGKTTLVAEWLRQKQISGLAVSAWISLEGSDNDPSRFFAYVTEALQATIPDLDPAIMGLLELPTLPPIEAVLTELINDLEEQLSQRKLTVVLVLDDYFLIQNPVIHQGLEFLIEHQPEGLHLLIATRADPPLPLARLRARGQIVEIRMADLRFSMEEAGLFFQQSYGLVLSREDLILLDGRTEGWIAGLQLAGLVLHEDTLRSPDGTVDPGTIEQLINSVPHYVIDYLVEEVLERLPRSTQDFLIKSSVLNRLNAELCDAVLSSSADRRQDSASILDFLSRTNLFIVPLDDEKKWYRYHQLFADVLRSNLSAQEESDLHQRAAGWLETNGYLEEALDHSLSAGDMKASMRIITCQADLWMKRGEIYTLLSHLSALPENEILSNNDLTAYYGFALLFAGNGTEATRLAGAAQPDPEERLSLGRLMTLTAWLANAANEPQMIDLAREAIELLGDADPFFQALSLIVLGSGLAWEGNFSASSEAYLEAYKVGQKIDHPFLAIGSLINLAYNLQEQGNFREGISLCESAQRRYVDSRSRPLPLASMLDGPLASLYFEMGEWDKARQHATTGLERCRHLFSTAILGGNAEVILARLDFIDGHLEKALSFLRQMRQYGEAHHLEYLSFKMAYAEAALHLLNDDLYSARRLFEELSSERYLMADMNGIGKRLSGIRQVLAFLQARILLAEGKAVEALPLLQQIAAGSQGLRRIEIGVIHSLVLARLNQLPSAREKLDETITLAANSGCIWAFHSVGKKEKAVLWAMLRQARPLAPGFIDQVIRSDSAVSSVSDSRARFTTLPEPLSEQELKVLRLLASGCSNQQVAGNLVISLGTAKWHVHNVLQKLGASSRSQAIAVAKEMGML